jgi:hypothetical protein
MTLCFLASRWPGSALVWRVTTQLRGKQAIPEISNITDVQHVGNAFLSSLGMLQAMP